MFAGRELGEIQFLARIDGRDQHVLVARAGRRPRWQLIHREGMQMHVDDRELLLRVSLKGAKE
jgi:hypothetical protein